VHREVAVKRMNHWCGVENQVISLADFVNEFNCPFQALPDLGEE
jgi:hypothetical protein